MSRALCGTCYVITTISCHATLPSFGTIEANGIAIYGMHVHVVIKRDVVNQGGACVIVTNHQKFKWPSENSSPAEKSRVSRGAYF